MCLPTLTGPWPSKGNFCTGIGSPVSMASELTAPPERRTQSQGTVPEVSGCVAELAKQAQVLCQGDEGTVVSVESAERKVLLSRVGGVTTAIFMRPGGVA